MSLLSSLLCVATALLCDPSPIVVSDELLAQTSMPEASGVVWNTQLQRYLVISDDTGKKELGTNHAPWLFLLAKEGVFDRAPIPIVGIEKLNDAEAICDGPWGTYFLATSHSENKKGKKKADRRVLLHLKTVGKSLQVLASLDLAQAILDSGLIASASVDIEALSFRQKDLYVGLKFPLTPSGDAIVLRVADVLSTLKTGTIRKEQVTKFAEFPLQVPAANGPGMVREGISDMTFLPDGRLLLLGNSPKKLPPDGGGALWMRNTDGSLSLLRRFVGLKPEGIAMSASKTSLVIVFDNDRKPPLWLHIPIPNLRTEPKSGTPNGN
ncbi:MAG TPA: hypothetical protein PKE31_10555 [Pseudomonadota bacterium]|nr:hypothetical protein [Pseudomonadota bacterium]